MPKPPVIELWRRGRLFGVSVLTGYVEGRRICARHLWTSHYRFGIARGELGCGTEEVLEIGEPAPGAWGIEEKT